MNKSMSKNSVNLDTSSHILNNSSSKQKFSFPKASRFDQSKFGCDSFYQMPSTRTGRTTSFGYGHKDIGLRINTNLPEPGTYNLQSEFDGQKQRKRGYSFGSGREQMAIGGPLNQTLHSRQLPGPGNYKNYTTLQTRGPALKSRLPDRSLDYLKKNPGPGAYAYESFAGEQYYVNSRYKNSTNSTKMTQKSLRLNGLHKTIQLGPGSYNPIQSDIKKDGRYILSQDKGSQSKVFSKSPRESIVYKHLLSTPGPGSYSPFTYFGPA